MEIGHHAQARAQDAFAGKSVRIQCSKRTDETPPLADAAVDAITKAPVYGRDFTRWRSSSPALIWSPWVDRGAKVQ